LPRVRGQLRTARGTGDRDPARLGHAGATARVARLCGGRHLHRRRGDHPARRGVAADAGDPDVPALRGRHPRRALARTDRRGDAAGLSADASPLAQPAPGRPAGFWQRSVAWSIDATLIAPIAAWLGWPWISASGQAWIEQVR